MRIVEPSLTVGERKLAMWMDFFATSKYREKFVQPILKELETFGPRAGKFAYEHR